MTSAREDILGRVRQAIGAKPPSLEDDYAQIPRNYVETEPWDPNKRLELFEDRLVDYDCIVHRCWSYDVSAAIAHALESRGKQSLLVPSGIPLDWLPNGFDFFADKDLSYEQINSYDGVLTGCALAIASTGTIVLRHTQAEGRRALTLIPDYHLCVVHASQIVDTVVDGIRRMAQFGSLPITTISGPSATADIEMTRVKGVHGPRTLEVIIALD